MGSGNSKETSVELINKQLIINKNDIKMLTENINKTTTNVIQETTKNCTVSGLVGNETSHSFGDVGGDFVSYTDQVTDGNIKLSCLQESSMKSDIINEVSQQLTNALKNNMTSDAFAQLQADAQSATEKGFLSMPEFGNKSETDTKLINDITTRNESSKELTNIISNITEHTFSNKNLQECYSTAQSINKDIKNVGNVRGNVNLTTIQNVKLDAVLSCIQKDENISKIINKTASVLGVSVIDEQVNTSKTDVGATTKSSDKSTGPIQDIFSGMKGMTLPIIIAVIASVSCIVIIGVVLVMVGPKMLEQAGNIASKQGPGGSLNSILGSLGK